MNFSATEKVNMGHNLAMFLRWIFFFTLQHIAPLGNNKEAGNKLYDLILFNFLFYTNFSIDCFHEDQTSTLLLKLLHEKIINEKKKECMKRISWYSQTFENKTVQTTF